jgi:hypothetical protein
MNIEEARKVLWLKSNPRPLGELLDEGFLTKDRLEWAAKSAYKPELKEAARVILDSISSLPLVTQITDQQETYGVNFRNEGIEVGISRARARATLWPFRPHRDRAMGDLVDTKQLSLKDLAYAIENAWDDRVRKAATALSLERLNQIVQEPVPSAGFVHVISGGRSYSQRRESFYTLLQGAFIGFLITLAAFFLVSSIRQSRQPVSEAVSLTEFISRPGGILGLAIAIAILLFVGWLFNFIVEKINNRLDEQIEQYRRGQEGEDNVVQSIVQALDGNWHLLRNLSLPGRNKGDLDLVLVGPPGIWTLEVKNFRGEYRNIGESWEWRNSRDWKVANVNPSRQALNSAYRLKNFLKADKINVFVNSAVIWANSESQLTVENPSVSVWRYDRLPDELGNIWQGEKLPEAERITIVNKLTKLCEHQRRQA